MAEFSDTLLVADVFRGVYLKDFTIASEIRI